MIWFRIEYDDGDEYVIFVKLGSLVFKSIYKYKIDELADAIKDLSQLQMDDEEEEEENKT